MTIIAVSRRQLYGALRAELKSNSRKVIGCEGQPFKEMTFRIAEQAAPMTYESLDTQTRLHEVVVVR